MKKGGHRTQALFLGAVALLASVTLLVGTARTQPAQRFSEAEIFLELNDTDGDLGLHAVIDGEPWTSLQIRDTGRRPILRVDTTGRLRAQGLTELSFESAEPEFEELAPAEFFERFPAGFYPVVGRGLEGGRLRSNDLLSHVLAAPPSNVLVSGLAAAENCDADPLPVVSAPVVIDWDPVTASHPDIGAAGPVEIRRYQLFVEGEAVRFGIDLAPSITEFEVPGAITDLGEEFKFEIIAQTTTGNNTAVESCFIVQ